MSNILHVASILVLLCVPVSLVSVVLSRPHYKELWGHDMPLRYFMEAWGISYLISLLFAAVAFCAAVGVAMLAGAFR